MNFILNLFPATVFNVETSILNPQGLLSGPRELKLAHLNVDPRRFLPRHSQG